ncbi:MAG TPA: hypothetical protein VFY10_03680 [Dehalococcoidia bacterium]|nr:hypothetical protein [Dehalococcoidia bacterium]
MDSSTVLGIGNIIVAACLVFITLFYAVQTKRTVNEMREARAASVLPSVGLSIDLMGGGIFGHVCIHNVGTGPALDVDVEMTWLPGGSPYPWKIPVLAPGQRFKFTGPGDDGFNLKDLTKNFEFVELTGACRDSLGKTHSIINRLRIREIWTTDVHLDSWWVLDTQVEEDSLKKLDDMSSSLRKIASAVEAPETRRRMRRFKAVQQKLVAPASSEGIETP